MAEKTQTKKNSFRVRIYDNEVLTSIEELFATKQFDSMNDLLGRAIAIGIEKIYKEFGKRKSLSSPIEPEVPESQKMDEAVKQIRNMELTVDDIFVMLSIIETMTTTLYNVEAAKADGEPVSSELMDSGFFAELPKSYQEVKDQLIRRMEQKKEKLKNAQSNI